MSVASTTPTQPSAGALRGLGNCVRALATRGLAFAALLALFHRRIAAMFAAVEDLLALLRANQFPLPAASAPAPARRATDESQPARLNPSPAVQAPATRPPATQARANPSPSPNPNPKPRPSARASRACARRAALARPPRAPRTPCRRAILGTATIPHPNLVFDTMTRTV